MKPLNPCSKSEVLSLDSLGKDFPCEMLFRSNATLIAPPVITGKHRNVQRLDDL